MPSFNNRQLIKGMILLSALLLIVACAEPAPPYAVVHEPEEAPKVKAVEAAIPAPEPEPEPIAQPEPVETVVYEAEHPETYIVQ